MPEKTVLDNGLRIVTETFPHAQSVTVAVFVASGSRHERDGEQGASHFLEHLVFQGSARRDNQFKVARAIEGVGGSLNGFTHHEATCYHAVTLAEDFELAMDVIIDMVLYPCLHESAMEKERQIILQEIKSNRESGAAWVHELVQQRMFQDHPLGQLITGAEQNVAALTRAQCVAYQQANYRPNSLVLAVAGNVEHGAVVELARRYFEPVAPGSPVEWGVPPNGQAGPAVVFEPRTAEQLHLCLGFRALPHRHPDSFVLGVIDILLGSGVTSRLFQEIRENLGLAYDVGSYTQPYRDAGAFVLYASVEPKRAVQCLRAILGGVDRLKEGLIDEEELREAKQFAKGTLLLGLEGPGAYAMMLGERELLTEELFQVEEISAGVNRVTTEDIQRVSQELLRSEGATLAVVPPKRWRSEGKLIDLMASW
ncbi:MAG: hypothetical protein AUJ96_07410 [Armatimonadetes bacterium CG2_30_66_41]|nr:insulinase family protein [Armatimonadota bacterium]OIP07425.1 MAG: hypothetical protein AUJ96_07410 [Armatimonadetes bacterium CG2_30_66_41]NCO89816.1 insulinase family protein [Armatimonadota bacterium]NCP34322.1 insulinase family protein [Armatimonadota bacterium]NCQ29102.1 insulinase family protein [Armatimonadota bacterium]